MKFDFSGTVPVLCILTVQILIVVGWILNIVKIIGAINDPVTVMLFLRVIGIISFPLGGILGYL